MSKKGKPVLFVSFSGGATSGYMCKWLIDNVSGKYDLKFLFANTGQEHEKTLEFVDQCDSAFGLDLVWLEAVINPERGKGTGHKVVSFETASRNGEPFEEMIKVYGIPNVDYPHCNRELKIATMEHYMHSIGFKRKHPRCIGIRSDEIDRMTSDPKCVYPLISWHPTTKGDIYYWWQSQPFKLEIPEHMGNCVTCWKKSDRKLMTIAKHEPERFEFFDRMERLYPNCGAGDQERVFFMRYQSAADIIARSSEPFNEFIPHPPEQQYSFINEIDPLDIEFDCGQSCEAQ